MTGTTPFLAIMQPTRHPRVPDNNVPPFYLTLSLAHSLSLTHHPKKLTRSHPIAQPLPIMDCEDLPLITPTGGPPPTLLLQPSLLLKRRMARSELWTHGTLPRLLAMKLPLPILKHRMDPNLIT